LLQRERDGLIADAHGGGRVEHEVVDPLQDAVHFDTGDDGTGKAEGLEVTSTGVEDAPQQVPAQAIGPHGNSLSRDPAVILSGAGIGREGL
jgi:hypothetical protein